MKNFYHSALLTGFLWVILFSCRKDNLSQYNSSREKEKPPVCFDCDFIQQRYADTADHPTILGADYKNPYLVNIMQEAYRRVYKKEPGNSVHVSHLYIRFSPKNYQELARLEETGIELFDYPLHRYLITEGDYYLQAGKQMEDIPDYFAVVTSGTSLPKGIQAQIIDKMFIPDNDPLLENEALRLTGNLLDANEFITGNKGSDELKNLYPDPNENGTDETSLFSAGNHCNHYPSGSIVVQNELRTDKSYRPVPNLHVVIKRLLKVDKVYTDVNGYFKSNKYFRNKYTVVVKFKNSQAHIARMRKWAIHEQFFPIRINFGKWDRLDCGHIFRIKHPAKTGQISTSHWCAAVTFNGIREYRQFCNEEQIANPPDGLHVMLSQKQGSGNGNTYMLHKIMISNPAAVGVEVVLTDVLLYWSPVAAGISFLAFEAFKARAPDIKYGYGGDYSYLTTDRYGELVYHELSHASHYKVVGNAWWIDFGLAESKNEGPGFYGSCCTKYAPRIALAEGWSYFMGHYLADKKWGLQSTSFPEQGNLQTRENLLYFSCEKGFSSHIRFIESYDPHRFIDYNYWIPKGLFYDLMDPDHEIFPGNAIRDNVSGFTCRQIFEAMEKDVQGMEGYKQRLLKKNPFNAEVAVIDLFRQYGY